MKNRLKANTCLRLVGGVAILLSMGCTVLDDPDPDREQNCEDQDTIPEVVEQDFFASSACASVDYIVVVREGTLEVEPGTTLTFGEGGGIRVEEDGALWARGTQDEEILFTGEDATPGAWKGIYFYETMNRNNMLEFITIEFAGGAVWDDEVALGPANLSVWNSRVALSDFTFRKSDGYGVHFEGDDSIIRIRRENQITANNEEPVRIAPNLVDFLTSDTTYQGNESDFILVTEGTVADDATWQDFDVPIAIAGRITIDADLSIDSGNEIVFLESGEIDIDDGEVNGETDPDREREADEREDDSRDY